MFEEFGFLTPLKTFYMNLSDNEHLVLLLALVSFHEINNYFTYDKKSGGITKKNKSDDFDFHFYIYGLYVLLYQMGNNNIILFITLMTYILKAHLINQYTIKDYKGLYDKNTETPTNILLLQVFLQELGNTFGIEKKYYEMNVNRYIIDRAIS